MDIPISDLLDTLQEVDLDLQPKVRVPEDRIEELTMKKLMTIAASSPPVST